MPSLKPEQSIRQHKSLAEGKGIFGDETFGVQAIREHDRPAGPNTTESHKKPMADGNRAIGGPNKKFHTEPKHHNGDWNEY